MRHSHPKASESKSSTRTSATAPRRQPIRRQQQIDELVKKFRRELEERFGSSDEILTIDEIEAAACDIREHLGKAIAEEITQAEADAAQAQENQQPAHREVCRKCSRSRPYQGSQERTIVTMAGDVIVRRRVYYCRRCKHCTMPVDRRLGLPEHRFTAQVERWVARLCVKDTFERAMEELEELGRVSVSTKEAQRIVLAMGEYAQKVMQADVEAALPKHPKCAHLLGRNPGARGEQYHDPEKTGYISMDGVMVPRDIASRDKDERSPREAKLGRVDLVQETPGRKEPGKTLKSLYCFHLGGPDECAQQTYALAARAGVTELSRLVAIADGAEWIWRRIEQYFPRATQILDWYHAVEHLSAAVRVCVAAEACDTPEACVTGEACGTPEMASPDEMKRTGRNGKTRREETVDEQRLTEVCAQWIEPLETQMWEGKLEALLSGLSQLPQPTPEAADIVRETIGYFRRQSKRMRYDQYRKKGFDVGSGAMESGCKQVVTARMKGAGMRWSETGAQAIGHLRALYLSTSRWTEVIGTWTGRGLAAVPSC